MAADNPNDGVAPMPGQDSSPPPSGDAASRVLPPAIALMITAGLGIAYMLLNVAVQVLGVGAGMMQGMQNFGPEQQSMMQLSTGLAVVISLVAVVLCGLVIFGANCMRKLQNYNVAFAACIVAMIPCFGSCCILGIPFGIWGLVMLTKEEIKTAFVS